MPALETGTLLSSSLPAGQRAYYEQLLLDTLRTQSILVPFCAMKEDFRARDTGQIVYSEVFDPEPNWNAVSESVVWLTGSHLDSRTVTINLEIHGDVIKVSDYNELVNFWANGDLRGLCRGKLGASQVKYLDMLARNAFLSSPYKTYAGSGNTSRYDLAQADVFDPDIAETIRVHLEEKDIPGVIAVEDGGAQTIVCVTSPRVIYDIRMAAGSGWTDIHNYHQTGAKFRSEVGAWGGVRFVKTNRNRLLNYGLVTVQTTLNGATVVGQGAAATVDSVYSVGQSTSTRYVTVADETGFAVGDIVTIHSASDTIDDGAGAYAVNPADGTQETRKIVSIDAANNRLSFDRPLMKAHSDSDYVTKAIDIHASFFMGGPSVVYAVGERPTPFVLPKIDDLQMVQRFSWRAFCKMQMFRPEWLEVVESGGSTV